MMKYWLFLFLFFLDITFIYAQCSLSFSGTDVSCPGGSDGLISVELIGAGSGGATNNCEEPAMSPESCSGGCISINNNASVTANNGDTYCITTNGYSGAITLNSGSKVIICGNAEPQDIFFNGGELVVNGSLIITDTVYFWSLNSTLRNYGDVAFSSGITLELNLENHGEIEVSGNFAVGNNGSFANYGSFSASGNFSNNNTTVNHGMLTVGGTLSSFWNKVLTNNCTISSANLLNQSVFTNNGSVSVSGNCTLEGGSYSASAGTEMAVGGNLYIGSSVEGLGNNCSSIRLTGNNTTTINWGASFSGEIRLCDPNGVETNNPGIAGTYLNCNCQINNNVCTYEWKDASGAVIGSESAVSNLGAGMYTIAVSCTECQNSPLLDTIYLTEPAPINLSLLVTQATCANENRGSIDLTVTGGTSPYLFDWNDGSYNTEDLSNVQPGKYRITVTDANNCQSSDSADVTGSGIVISYTKTDISCGNTSASEGSIDLTVTGGTPPYVYSWSNGASTEDLTGLSEGIYTVLVSDNAGCSDTLTVTILGDGGPGLQIAVSSEACNQRGSANLSVSGGTPPYSYLWSNGAVTEDIAGLAAGEYWVRVTDASNCISSDTIVVDADFPFELSVSYSHVTSYGANDGTAIVSVDNGDNQNENGSNACADLVTTTENCTTGCHSVISTDNGALFVYSDQKICLTAASFTSDITVYGGLLIVCGSASPANFQFHGGSVIITGSLNIPNQYSINSNNMLANYGSVTSAGVAISGTLNNYGTYILSSGSLQIYSGATMYNTGDFSIESGILDNSGGTVTNAGILEVDKTIELQQSGTFVNNCTLETDSLISHGGFTNRGKITASFLNILNPGSTVTLSGGTSIVADEMILNGATINNQDTSCAIIRALTNMTIGWGTTVSGNVSLCAEGTLTNNATGLSAYQNCNCMLPSASCSVTWSNNQTGDTLTGLGPGVYTATINCGTCTVYRDIMILEQGVILINTEHVDSLPFMVDGPGLETVQAFAGTSASELALEPQLPLNNDENTLTLTIPAGQDNTRLELKIGYNRFSHITTVKAGLDEGYLDMNTDYYEVVGGNKLYLYNQKPSRQPFIISTNLIKGLKLDPQSKVFELIIPDNAVFTSKVLSIYKINEESAVEVVPPGTSLIWNAEAAEAGLYEFRLELTSENLTGSYKGQFIIDESSE